MYSKSKRFIASFLAVLMAVCMLPAEMLGGIATVHAAATLTATFVEGSSAVAATNNVASGTAVSISATDTDSEGITHIVWSTSSDLTSMDNAAILAAWSGLSKKEGLASDNIEISGTAGATVTLTAAAVKYTPAVEADEENNIEAADAAVVKSVAESYAFTINDTRTSLEGATVTLSTTTPKVGDAVPTVTKVEIPAVTEGGTPTEVQALEYDVTYTAGTSLVDVTLADKETELKALPKDTVVTVKVTAKSTSTTYKDSATETYTVQDNTPATVAVPTASAEGEVASGTKVTLGHTDTTAKIYYVLKPAAQAATAPEVDTIVDETNEYKAPIDITEASSIFAVAQVGGVNSAVKEFKYTIGESGEKNPVTLTLDFSSSNFKAGSETLPPYDDGYFSFTHNKAKTIQSKSFKVDSKNTYKTEAGTYTYYYPGGSTTGNNSARAVKFTLSSNAEVIIGGSSGNANRKFGLLTDDRSALSTTDQVTCTETNTIYELNLKNLEVGKEYAVGSAEDLYLNYIVVKETDYKNSPTVVASEPSGAVQAGTKVTFKAPGGVDIYLAEGATVEVTDANKYDGTEIAINETKTITVVAKAGKVTGTPVTYEYTIAQPIAVAPEASVQSGVYTEAQSVTLSSTTAGATIYYTTDGKNPVGNANAQEANGAITVDKTQTIKAYAKSDATQASDVVTLTYIIKTNANKTYTMAPASEAVKSAPAEGAEGYGDLLSVGTDGYFRVVGIKAASPVISPIGEVKGTVNNVANTPNYTPASMTGWPTEAGELTADSKVLVLTGGQIKAENGAVLNALRFDASAKAKVTVYYAVKTDTATKIQVYKASKYDDSELGTAVTVTAPDSTNAAVAKAEFEVAEAGSYYIGFAASGGIIPYMTVEENPGTITPPAGTVAEPTFNPTAAEGATPFEYQFPSTDGKVKIEAETGATVYYALSTDTTNYPAFAADTYETNGTEYTAEKDAAGGIPVTEGMTIKAVAVKDGKASTVVTSPVYRLGSVAPLAGTVTATQDPTGDIKVGDTVKVTLSYNGTATGVKYLYTVGTDANAEPGFSALPANTVTAGSQNYDSETGIVIPTTAAGTVYVKVLAYTETTTGEGETATTTVTAVASSLVSEEYTVKSNAPAPAMPTATVNGNAVANNENVTVIDSATVSLTSADSADIYYTDDSSAPDSSSNRYGSSFTVNATKTIKAVAIKDGLSSDVLTFTVTVNSSTYDDEGDEENEDNDWWYKDKEEIKEKNNGKIPAGLWIAGIDPDGYDYKGDKITPRVRVYHNVHLLAEKVDYTISYKNNVNVPTTDAANKQPTIVVKGKGNYAKQETETFKINPRSMDDESVYIDDMTVLAKKNGAALKPVPTVTLTYWVNEDVEKERKLKNKKEFEIKYCTEAEYEAAESLDKITGTDSVSAEGSYRMIITGKGNYSGISSASLEVLKSDAILASKLKVKIGKIAYSKTEVEKEDFAGFKPSVEVTAGKTKLTEDTDYTLYYRNNYEAGTAYVTISPVAKTSGEGEDATTTYAFYGSRTVAFTITGKPIKSAKVTVKPEALTYAYNYYSGIINDSDITLEYKGTPMTQGEDYGISWIQNNWAAGKATIYIYGNGEYTGELKKTVKINPRDLSDSSISVTPDTISGEFSKGGTRPAITVKYTYDTENEYSYNLVEGRDYTVTYKNNNNFSKSPSLVIKGKGNFKGSITKTFTFDTKDISDVYFDVPNVVVNRGGKYGSKPVLSDRDGVKEVKLALKKDYTLAYYDMTEKADEPATEADGDNENQEEGTPISNINKFTDGKAGSVIKVVATAVDGSGYTGKAVRYYSIRENDFSKVKIKVANKEFTGKDVTLTADDITITGATLTLQESVDSETDGYYIDPASYVNNVKKGTAKVTLIGTGKYAGSKTVSFKITAKEVKWDRGSTTEEN